MKNRVLFGIAVCAAFGAANGVAAQVATSAYDTEQAEPGSAEADSAVMAPHFTPDTASNPDQPAARMCEPAAPDFVLLPKMTPVAIRIDANVDSKENQSGETFPLSLAEPVILDGIVVLPAGTRGQGEVIHAKNSGMAGSAGELIISASFLDFDGQRIGLRSMQMAKTGKSNIGLAGAIGAAPYIGPVAFFLSGKNIAVSEGTVAGAKLAQDVTVQLTENGGVAAGDCKMGVTE